MGVWKRVLLSGSNFHVNELTASLVGDIGLVSFTLIPESQRKVVTIDDNTGLFSVTGSYGGAGIPSSDVDWFPANTNMDIQAISTTPGNTGRNIFLRKSLTFGDPTNNGAANIYFYTSGSAVGLNDNTGYTLAILRGSGVDNTTSIIHKGNKDFVVKLNGPFTSSEFGHSADSRPNAVNDLYTQWTNPLLLQQGFVGNATLSTPFNNLGQLILKFNLPDTVNPNAILLGMEFKLRGKVNTGLMGTSWKFVAQQNSVTLSNSKTQNISSTSEANYLLGGETDLWGIFPQPGNTNVRVGDVAIVPASGPRTFKLLGSFTSIISTPTLTLVGSTTENTPSLKFWYKYSETDFVVESYDTDTGTFQKVLNINMGNNLFLPSLTNENTDRFVYYNTNTSEITQPTNIQGSPVSTRKVKKNIKNLDPQIVKNFNKLRPVSFNFKSNPNKTDLGFIAEEVAEVSPLLAKFDDKQNPINIDDRAIMALSVAKLQQLEKELNNI